MWQKILDDGVTFREFQSSTKVKRLRSVGLRNSFATRARLKPRTVFSKTVSLPKHAVYGSFCIDRKRYDEHVTSATSPLGLWLDYRIDAMHCIEYPSHYDKNVTSAMSLHPTKDSALLWCALHWLYITHSIE